MITKRIFEQVRDMIEEEARDKMPGDLLSSEVQYAEKFGVSRPTVRKAVDDLVRIGLIKRIPGKGLMLNTEYDIMNRGKLLIVLPYQVGDGFMFKIIMGCVEEANVLGFQYKIIGESKPEERLAIIKQEDLSQYTAAITCCYEDEYEYQIVDLLNNANLLVMLVDNPVKRGDFPCITCNDYDGGYTMGKYLAKRGHTRIINITGERPVITIERRNAGFFDALKDYGVDYDMSLFINGYTDEFLECFTADDFKSGKYTAICSHTTLAVMDLAQFIHDNNVRIGEDVSVIGYGDHPYISGAGIPVTSIEQPSMDMGKTAVDEISTALIERRQLKSIELDIRLVNRHTVKRI